MLKCFTIFAMIGLVLPACDSGLQQQLDDSKAKRFEAAKQAVNAVEAARTKELSEALPAADAKFDGSEHPMLTWRKLTGARDDGQVLIKLATYAKPEPGMTVGARGTPSQVAAELAAAYVKASKAYWGGESSLTRYVEYLHAFAEDSEKVRAEAAKAGEDFVAPPLLDEANFDLIFAHAARFWQLTKVPSRLAILASARADWEVIFKFPSLGHESFSDYVSRLCFLHKDIKPLCAGVPHEFRAQVVDRPFLEALKARAVAYKAAPGNKVFADVAQRFVASLDLALAQQPQIVEDPKLPSTVAAPGGISGLRVFMGKGGVIFHQDKIADAFTGQLPSGFEKKALEVVETISNTPGNRIDYQRIVLEMPGDASMTVLREAIRAMPRMSSEDRTLVKHVLLVGRRRADESLRRAAMSLKLPNVKTSKTFSFKFKEDSSKTSCDLMGFMGDALLGKKDTYYLEISKDRIRATTATHNEEEKTWTAGDTHDLGTPKDLTKLDKWLSENPGEIQLFLRGKYSYDTVSDLISHVLYSCKDADLVDPTDDTKTVKRTCASSEQRDVTVVLGLCGG